MPGRSGSSELQSFSWDDAYRVRYWMSGFSHGTGALDSGALIIGGEHRDRQLVRVPLAPLFPIYPHHFKTEAEYATAVLQRRALSRLADSFQYEPQLRYDTARAEKMTNELADYKFYFLTSSGKKPSLCLKSASHL